MYMCCIENILKIRKKCFTCIKMIRFPWKVGPSNESCFVSADTEDISSFLILDTLSLQCNVFLFIFLFYLFNVFEINSEMLRSF